MVAGRFAARWFIQGSSIGADDWVILAAYISLIPSTIIVWLSPSIHLFVDWCLQLTIPK